MNKDEFDKLFNGWMTPNSYDPGLYKDPPQKSGVYILVKPFDENLNFIYEILYIGSSKYLYQRYERHEVKRILTEIFGSVHFYWKEFDNYKSVEKNLIKKFQPKFNKQWR